MDITTYALLKKKIDQLGISDSKIEEVIENFLLVHPEYIGATDQQAAQIIANTAAIQGLEADEIKIVTLNEYNALTEEQKKEKNYLIWDENTNNILIDNILDENSTNPVQNKVITREITELKKSVSDDKIKQIVEQHFEENPVQVITDNTLSVAGIPADALATGTAVDSLKGDLDYLNNVVRTVKNICNPDDIVRNSYWYSPNSSSYQSGWSRVKVNVEPNTKYTLANVNEALSWFSNDANDDLGKVKNGIIETPDNCTLICISIYSETENAIVIDGEVYDKITYNNYPYLQIIETKVEKLDISNEISGYGIVNVMNVANPENVMNNKYWDSANHISSSTDFHCIRVKVEPNTTYTVYGAHLSFSWFGDIGGNSLGKITTVPFITTPDNCYYLYITRYKSSNFIVLNDEYYGDLIYDAMPYNKVLYHKINNLDISNNLKTNNVPYYKTTILYVSTDGSDENGDGSSENPYATIYKANSVITNANEKNRYIIKVADGTYTDLQAKYSGISKVDGQNYLGVICKSYVSYIGNVEHPENCIIEWNGATGLESKVESGTLVYDDIVRKCPFHIVHTLETHVSGFKIVGRNLRYAMHIESEGFGKDTKFTLKNMIFDWFGNPESKEYKNASAIGIGSSGWEVGEFDNIKIIFEDTITSKLAFQTHDNNNQEGTPIAIGCDYTVKNVDFGGGRIELRTLFSQMSDNKYTCSFVNCYGISEITNIKAEHATKVNWAYELRFTEIGN